MNAFEDEWSRFLTDINSVPEILKTASQGYPKAFQKICSEIKNIIRRDSTLAFLWHARGSDFHGLESGAQPEVKGAKYRGYESNPPIKFQVSSEDGTSEWLSSGAIVLSGDARKFSFKYALTSVTDQYGNTFNPPTKFLGAALLDSSPAGVGESAAEYYRKLLSDMSVFISR